MLLKIIMVGYNVFVVKDIIVKNDDDGNRKDYVDYVNNKDIDSKDISLLKIIFKSLIIQSGRVGGGGK